MAKYINEGINVVNFTEISYVTKVKDDGSTSEYAKVTTTAIGDGAINTNFLFPYKFWEFNKDKDGKIKDDATQKKEWDESLKHIFGAAVSEEVYNKALSGKTTFKEKIEAVAAICANNGNSFRMKFVADKNGKYTTWRFNPWGTAEKTSVNPSKLKFVHSMDSKEARLKKIAEKAGQGAAVGSPAPQVPTYSNTDDSDELPF